MYRVGVSVYILNECYQGELKEFYIKTFCFKGGIKSDIYIYYDWRTRLCYYYDSDAFEVSKTARISYDVAEILEHDEHVIKWIYTQEDSIHL